MMIKRLEMMIIHYNVLIDLEKDNIHCLINDKICNLEKEDVDNIIRIIRSCNNLEYSKKVIGETEYYINIIYDNKEDKYIFSNQFPTNFNELVEYIGGTYDR